MPGTGRGVMEKPWSLPLRSSQTGGQTPGNGCAKGKDGESIGHMEHWGDPKAGGIRAGFLEDMHVS